MVGFGFMGKAHLFGYRTIPFYYGGCPIEYELDAVCTRSMETAQKAKALFGFRYATCDLDDFFGRDLDIIHICTPNLQHKECVLRAMEKGAHIYCEKPMTVSLEEARELEEKAAAYEGVMQMVFNNRFFPSTLRAKQLIDEGELGRLISVRARYLLNSNISAKTPITWRTGGKDQGGVLLDLGAHIIDLVHYLAGDIDRICGYTDTCAAKCVTQNGVSTDVTQNQAFIAVMQMKNGAMGSLEGSKMVSGASNDMKIELNYEFGSLKIDFDDPNILYYYNERDPDGAYGGSRGYKLIQSVHRYSERAFPSEKHSMDWMRGHVHSLCTFLKGVSENVCMGFGMQNDIYVQNVAKYMLKSGKTGYFTKI